MKILDRNELRVLIETQGKPCVSLYMPTHQSGDQTQQDPIRFKNLLREADSLLAERGIRAIERREILETSTKLMEDRTFWRHQTGGLAVFISPQQALQYKLPLHVEELAVINDRFHVKPLLKLFNGDGRFHVLSLSQNDTRLFDASRFSMTEIPLDGVPTNLAEALRIDEPNKQLQFHTRSAQRQGRRDAMFFGAGDTDPDFKRELLQFFHQLDAGLQRILPDQNIPLVLAGVEYLLPIFRQATSHSRVADHVVTGNWEDANIQTLHARAWEAVEPMFSSLEDKALQAYATLTGQNDPKAAQSLKTIVTAAHQGRIDTAFIPEGSHVWGQFNPDTLAIHLSSEARHDVDDLLDYIASHTILHGGQVFTVDPGRIVPGSSAGAILRY